MNVEVMRIRMAKLLEMYPYLRARAYHNADTNAIDTLIDVDTAVDRADLDNTDLFIIQKIYLEDYTQLQLSAEYGLTRDSIRHRTKKILSRVGKAYYIPRLTKRRM